MANNKSTIQTEFKFQSQGEKSVMDVLGALMKMVMHLDKTLSTVADRQYIDRIERIGHSFKRWSGILENFFNPFITSAKAYETSITKIGFLLKDNQALLDGYAEGMLDFSVKTGISATDLAKGMYDVVSAGTEVDKQMETMQESAKLSVVALGDMETSVKLTTSIMHNYSDTMKSARDATQLLNNIVIYGKTNLAELSRSFGILIPTAAQLGISIEEVGGALATLTRSMPTRRAVTSLNALMNALISKAGKFEEYGVDIIRVIGEEGLAGAMRAIQKISQGDIRIQRSLIGSQRAMLGTMGLLGKSYETMISLTGKMKDSNNELDKAFERYSQSYEATINRLYAQWEKFKILIGAGSLPVLKGIANQLASLTAWFTSLTESQREAAAKAVIFGIAIAGLFTVIGTLLIIVGQVLRSFHEFSMTIEKLNIFLGAKGMAGMLARLGSGYLTLKARVVALTVRIGALVQGIWLWVKAQNALSLSTFIGKITALANAPFAYIISSIQGITASLKLMKQAYIAANGNMLLYSGFVSQIATKHTILGKTIAWVGLKYGALMTLFAEGGAYGVLSAVISGIYAKMLLLGNYISGTFSAIFTGLFAKVAGVIAVLAFLASSVYMVYKAIEGGDYPQWIQNITKFKDAMDLASAATASFTWAYQQVIKTLEQMALIWNTVIGDEEAKQASLERLKQIDAEIEKTTDLIYAYKALSKARLGQGAFDTDNAVKQDDIISLAVEAPSDEEFAKTSSTFSKHIANLTNAVKETRRLYTEAQRSVQEGEEGLSNILSYYSQQDSANTKSLDNAIQERLGITEEYAAESKKHYDTMFKVLETHTDKQVAALKAEIAFEKTLKDDKLAVQRAARKEILDELRELGTERSAEIDKQRAALKAKQQTIEATIFDLENDDTQIIRDKTTKIQTIIQKSLDAIEQAQKQHNENISSVYTEIYDEKNAILLDALQTEMSILDKQLQDKQITDKAYLDQSNLLYTKYYQNVLMLDTEFINNMKSQEGKLYGDVQGLINQFLGDKIKQRQDHNQAMSQLLGEEYKEHYTHNQRLLATEQDVFKDREERVKKYRAFLEARLAHEQKIAELEVSLYQDRHDYITKLEEKAYEEGKITHSQMLQSRYKRELEYHNKLLALKKQELEAVEQLHGVESREYKQKAIEIERAEIALKDAIVDIHKKMSEEIKTIREKELNDAITLAESRLTNYQAQLDRQSEMDKIALDKKTILNVEFLQNQLLREQMYHEQVLDLYEMRMSKIAELEGEDSIAYQQALLEKERLEQEHASNLLAIRTELNEQTIELYNADDLLQELSDFSLRSIELTEEELEQKREKLEEFYNDGLVLEEDYQQAKADIQKLAEDNEFFASEEMVRDKEIQLEAVVNAYRKSYNQIVGMSAEFYAQMNNIYTQLTDGWSNTAEKSIFEFAIMSSDLEQILDSSLRRLSKIGIDITKNTSQEAMSLANEIANVSKQNIQSVLSQIEQYVNKVMALLDRLNGVIEDYQRRLLQLQGDELAIIDADRAKALADLESEFGDDLKGTAEYREAKKAIEDYYDALEEQTRERMQQEEYESTQKHNERMSDLNGEYREEELSEQEAFMQKLYGRSASSSSGSGKSNSSSGFNGTIPRSTYLNTKYTEQTAPTGNKQAEPPTETDYSYNQNITHKIEINSFDPESAERVTREVIIPATESYMLNKYTNVFSENNL